LELVIESVSRLIDDYCGRFFYQSAASTAFYTAQDYLVQPIDDFASVSAITTDGDANGTYSTSWVINTDCALAPFNAPATGRPFTEVIALTEGANTFPVEIVKAVKIVGTRGWPAVPRPVEMSCIIQSGRIFRPWWSFPLPPRRNTAPIASCDRFTASPCASMWQRGWAQIAQSRRSTPGAMCS
jgi:hypothetical protein